MGGQVNIKNSMALEILSLAENVGLARVAVAAFAAQVDITLNQVEEIKVAVSEAVSNAIIHGYNNQPQGNVKILVERTDAGLKINITDWGRGIADIALAMQPAYSTDPERMGLGFAFMQSFMDKLEVASELNQGTQVKMFKKLKEGPENRQGGEG